MSKPIRYLSLCLAFVACGAATSEAFAATPAPRAQAAAESSRYAAIVVEASTGEVLYARRADSPRYPASITKVMTLYLVFEEMAAGRLRPTDMIPVSARAASMPPTKLGLRAGETISVDDAIRALATRSANDMAVALAERVGGSETRFAALMTLRAQELGMSNTNFANASGLPDSRQVSSARDIAILSRAVMRDFPQYYNYFSLRSFQFRGQTINNHNRLMARMPEVDGLKTGFISSSGFNLAASGVRYGHRVIAVVLGGSSGVARDDNVQMLLTTGFDILRRRDQGETIVATQNLFEGAPASPAYPVGPAYPTYAQNTYGQSAYGTNRPAASPPASSDVAFTSYSRAPNLQIVSPRDTPLRQATPTQGGVAPSAAPSPYASSSSTALSQPGQRGSSFAAPQQSTPSPAGRSWGVQVGAFRNRNDAREQLMTIANRFDRPLNGTRAVIASYSDGFYRARFVGLDQAAAQRACTTLQARSVSCMVVAPD